MTTIPRGMVAGDRNSRGCENRLPLLRSRGSASGFSVNRGRVTGEEMRRTAQTERGCWVERAVTFGDGAMRR